MRIRKNKLNEKLNIYFTVKEYVERTKERKKEELEEENENVRCCRLDTSEGLVTENKGAGISLILCNINV